MGGGPRRLRMLQDVARDESFRIEPRDEHIVEPYEWIGGGQSRAGIVGVSEAIAVDVTGIEHRLDGAPPDVAAAQPYERTQAQRQTLDLERLAGRNRVEVPDQHMKPVVLMAGDAAQQRTKLQDSAPLRPGGVHRAQMHTEEPHALAGRHHFDERVARDPRPYPFGECDRTTTQEAERLTRERSPFGHVGQGVNSLDVGGFRRLLQQHQIGCTGVDDCRDRIDAAMPAVLNVVGEQAKHQSRVESLPGDGISGFSNKVRYGCPSRSPRSWMTKSRDAWIFTGRPTMSINIRRSGTRSGAMSGASWLNGREWTPGTKNPVGLKSSTAPAPINVTSRSLVPRPSASNGALSFQRRRVTALPRKIAVVPGGTVASIVRQNASNSAPRPPNASAMTLSRFSCSASPP